jgi:hypothetical protein
VGVGVGVDGVLPEPPPQADSSRLVSTSVATPAVRASLLRQAKRLRGTVVRRRGFHRFDSFALRVALK